MAHYCFWDTETTGLDRSSSQIVQIAAVLTDEDFQAVDSFDYRCRCLPWITPSPEALAVTGMTRETIDAAPLSSYEMITLVEARLRAWGPCFLAGYNSIAFDEEHLRHQFFQNLHPPYMTQTGGNSRVDILRLVRLATVLAPGALEIPVVDGRPSYRLGGVARANGVVFPEECAHDAYADVLATLGLAATIRERAPRAFAAMTYLSAKRNVEGLLRSHPGLSLVDFPDGVPVARPVAFICQNPRNPNEAALADLSFETDTYLGMTADDIITALAERGAIRTIRLNALPPLVPSDRLEQGLAAVTDEAVLDARARALRAASPFRLAVGAALARRMDGRPESPHPEQRLYSGGFIPRADEEICRRFHRTRWSDRHEAAAGLADARLREFASRLVFHHAPDSLPAQERERMEAWQAERIANPISDRDCRMPGPPGNKT